MKSVRKNTARKILSSGSSGSYADRNRMCGASRCRRTSCMKQRMGRSRLWGRGCGSEAIAYGAEWAFRALGLHRVEANIMPRNTASRRAAAKAGLVEEGLSRKYLKINGVLEDHIHMVRLTGEN